jgi:hypothetical protein
MFSIDVQPLSWVFAKKRPTQFASRKNTPGKDYTPNTAQLIEEVNAGATSGPTERILVAEPNPLQQTVLDHLAKRQVEVQELPKPE